MFFLMAGRQSVIDNKSIAFTRAMMGIREACRIFRHESELIPNQIATRYNLRPEDAFAWYKQVNIPGSSLISEGALEKAVNVLYQSKVLTSTDVERLGSLSSALHPRFAQLEKDIKVMKLYNKPELLRSLFNNLNANHLESGPINYQDLLPYDQHHYHGVEGLNLCAKKLGISSDFPGRLINIGSGLGGPARYFAGTFGTEVLAVELQEDLHRCAAELTERCGLNNRCLHLGGDFLQVGQHFQTNAYDFIVSWLTILHIKQKDRATLFKLCYSILKPGGSFYAEDFYDKGNLTSSEKTILSDEVFCSYLPSLSTYTSDLVSAGFQVVEAEDVTTDFMDYTRSRVNLFETNRDDLIRIHREDTVTRLKYFYSVVRDLYEGGNLGGIRILVKKPN